ncbi:hypothetical protein LCGC14_0548950 [marine sediment metagenome]|uniref:Uncharacterized protein n=1 Tax=marine sediment metagenome TaxID=412755 RepID=A0A0F9S8V1_9ZZZZ
MKDWKGKLLATLVGCVFSLLVLIATLGATLPTKDTVSKMIAQESPYVKDQSLILYRLEQIEKKLDRLLATTPTE